MLFQIPWSHHVNIIDKVKSNPHKALHGLTTPIGIADYQVTTQEFPEDLRGYLPTHQELEHVLTQATPKLPKD